jgi:hypothetical protein
MKPYYGLSGTQLNIAIACIAGTDFALFGYDQVRPTICALGPNLIAYTSQGVMGGLLTLPSFLKVFPEIDTQNPPPGSSATQASNIQGM